MTEPAVETTQESESYPVKEGYFDFNDRGLCEKGAKEGFLQHIRYLEGIQAERVERYDRLISKNEEDLEELEAEGRRGLLGRLNKWDLRSSIKMDKKFRETCIKERDKLGELVEQVQEGRVDNALTHLEELFNTGFGELRGRLLTLPAEKATDRSVREFPSIVFSGAFHVCLAVIGATRLVDKVRAKRYEQELNDWIGGIKKSKDRELIQKVMEEEKPKLENEINSLKTAQMNP